MFLSKYEPDEIVEAYLFLSLYINIAEVSLYSQQLYNSLLLCMLLAVLSQVWMLQSVIIPPLLGVGQGWQKDYRRATAQHAR